MIDNDTPGLACSPDGLVHIPGEEGGIVELKCPYTIAKEGQDPLSAAKTLKMLFCKASVEGNLELKRRHDYFYQVQGTMAIMGRSWFDFIVWSPKGMSVERIKFEQDLWAEAKPNLLDFYQKALLPEFALPRLPHGQPIRDLTSADDVTIPV